MGIQKNKKNYKLKVSVIIELGDGKLSEEVFFINEVVLTYKRERELQLNHGIAEKVMLAVRDAAIEFDKLEVDAK